MSDFSKYYFKTATLCLLFLSSHIFTALEFDFLFIYLFIYLFFQLFWYPFLKLVKPRDHSEIKPPIRKKFRKKIS